MFKILIAFIFVVNQFSYARSAGIYKPSSESKLEMVTFAFNSAQNIGQLIDLLSIVLNKEDIAEAKEFLILNKIKLSDPIPKIQLKAGKLSIGTEFVFNVNNDVISYDGITLKSNPNETFVTFLNRVQKTISPSKKSKSALWRILVSEAMAEEQKVNATKEIGKSILVGAAIGTGIFVGAAVLTLAAPGILAATATWSGVVGFTAVMAASGAVIGTTVGAATGVIDVKKKRQLACEPSKLIIKTEDHFFEYSFSSDNRVKLPVIIKRQDETVLKSVSELGKEYLDALNNLYYQACTLKRVTAVNMHLNSKQSYILNTSPTDTDSTGTR